MFPFSIMLTFCIGLLLLLLSRFFQAFYLPALSAFAVASVLFLVFVLLNVVDRERVGHAPTGSEAGEQPEAVFGYRGQTAFALIAAVVGLLGETAAVFLATADVGDTAKNVLVKALVALMATLGGAIFLAGGVRCHRAAVRTYHDRIAVSGLMKYGALRWDEIIRFEYSCVGAGNAAVWAYRLHSADRTLQVEKEVVDADRLVELVRLKTGLILHDERAVAKRRHSAAGV